MRGSRVCRAHGGAAGQTRASAARTLALRAAEADARATLAHEGKVPIEHPVDELAELAATVKATTASLGKRVNALSELRYEDAKGAEQIRAEMVLWGQWIDRLTRQLDVLTKANFEERRTRLAEEDGRLLAAAVVAVLRAHGVNPDDEKVRQDVRRELRLVQGGMSA